MKTAICLVAVTVYGSLLALERITDNARIEHANAVAACVERFDYLTDEHASGAEMLAAYEACNRNPAWGLR